MAQILTYSQQADGGYAATFVSSGEETHIYINRKSEGKFSVSSSPDPEAVRYCEDIKAERAQKDIHVTVKYVKGVTVRVGSSTEVTANSVIFTESPAPLIDDDEV